MDTERTVQQASGDGEISNTILSPHSFYQHDPLLVLLKNRLHLNMLWILSGVGVYFVLLFPLISQYRDFQPYTSLGDALDLILLSTASLFFGVKYLKT